MLLNNGNGTFTGPVPYAGGNNAEDMVAADLNGDGKLDLATAGWSKYDVSVMLNQGNGTFGAPVNYTMANASLSIAAADLDGDGKPDLVAGDHFNSQLLVLRNTCAP